MRWAYLFKSKEKEHGNLQMDSLIHFPKGKEKDAQDLSVTETRKGDPLLVANIPMDQRPWYDLFIRIFKCSCEMQSVPGIFFFGVCLAPQLEQSPCSHVPAEPPSPSSLLTGKFESSLWHLTYAPETCSWGNMGLFHLPEKETETQRF